MKVIRAQIEQSTSDYDKEKLQERLSRSASADGRSKSKRQGSATSADVSQVASQGHGIRKRMSQSTPDQPPAGRGSNRFPAAVQPAGRSCPAG